MNGSSKTILLTGASSGIGKATARLCAQKGHQIWATARDASRVPDIDRIHPLSMDLDDPSSITSAIEQARKESSGIDVLINNAGNGIFGPILGFQPDDPARQLNTLVIVPLEVIRQTMPELRKRRGQVITISSMGAQFPIPYLGPYSAGKAALSLLTEGLSVECNGSGVAFADLRPGDIRTDFNKGMQRLQLSPDIWNPGDLERGWQALEREIAAGPPPQCVARKICRMIETRATGRHTVGNWFQACLAPTVDRLLPRSLILTVLQKIYRL